MDTENTHNPQQLDANQTDTSESAQSLIAPDELARESDAAPSGGAASDIDAAPDDAAGDTPMPPAASAAPDDMPLLPMTVDPRPATAEPGGAEAPADIAAEETARIAATPILPEPAPLPAASAATDTEPGPLLPPSLDDSRILPLRMTPLRSRSRPRLALWAWLAGAAALLLLPAILASSLWPAIALTSPFGGPPDRIPRGATTWATTTMQTPLDPADSAFGAQSYPVDSVFASAYAARGGANALGPAITPAYQCNLGLIQFFAAGALLHVTSATLPASASAPGDLDPELARSGVRDAASGNIWLPLSQALLSAGSDASIGAGSDATYVTLRDATHAAALVAQPAHTKPIKDNAALPQTIDLAQGAFVVEGERGGKLVGHAIPATIWQYINQPQVAPDGWLADLGEPLTEATSITVSVNGQPHNLLAQAFWQSVIITDLDSDTDATWLQPVGLDFLRTLGAPAAIVSAGSQRWTTEDGALRVAAGSSGAAVSLGANAPITLTGATTWRNGALWYAAHWSTPGRSGTAWVTDTALTATQPSGMVYAGFDALSPSLTRYLTSWGNNVGAVAYDITRNTTYTYNPHGIFTMASSAKVPLMVTYLAYIESHRRSPNSFELSVLTAMIEHSDNNAAQVIYDTLGYQSGQIYYYRQWGITDYTPNVNGWGWGEWSPADMAHLLTLLYEGKVLNSADRALALHLMRNIESDQRFGVGDTAPAGANVAMKDGWVPEPDGGWAVNSSGIVIVGSETYIVTVYSGEQNSFGSGRNIVNHVCGAIGQALT